MMNYKYILFDWDGTVANTLDLWPDALDVAMQKRGYSLTRQQLIESTWGFVTYATGHTSIPADDATKVLDEAAGIVTNCLPEVALFPHVAEVLTMLKTRGLHLALITTSQRHMVMPVLQRHGIAGLFEAIVTDDDVGEEFRKPHPKPLLMALARMNGKPEEAIMVGDRDKDIAAGRNAGMDSALFCSAKHRRHYDAEKLLKCEPTYVIGEFCDMLKIIERVP